MVLHLKPTRAFAYKAGTTVFPIDYMKSL